MLFLSVVVFYLLSIVFCFCFEWSYTEKAYTLDGAPCLTNCLKRKCITNWSKEEKLCEPTGIPAPIYFTSQTTHLTRCLSNCGKFGYSYEWCVTSEEKDWDYCNSYEGSYLSGKGHELAVTARGHTCNGKYNYCYKHNRRRYKWCYIDKNNKWDYCAQTAIPRIPILPDNFIPGSLNYDEKCFKGEKNYDKSDINNDERYMKYITRVIQKDYTSLVKVIHDPVGPIRSYNITVVDLPKRLSVLVGLQMTITRKGLRNEINIAELVRKHLKETEFPMQVAVESGDALNEVDFVTSTSVFDTASWLNMTEKINDWTRSNDELDILIVVFYRNYDNPVPIAIGLTIVRENENQCLGVVFLNS